MNIAIIDYESGNISSVINSFKLVSEKTNIDIRIKVTSDSKIISNSDKVILPGQGSFKECMGSLLKINNLRESLEDFAIIKAKPLFGICVGMQMFADIGLEDTSESFGLPSTADFMFAIISNDKLEEAGQILVKQLKNRYGDPTVNKKFLVGIDRAKMKLLDLGDESQSDLVDTGKVEEDDDIPLFDKSTKGRMKNKKDFGEFKFE